MKEQLITLETAKLAKEKGFDVEGCFAIYQEKGNLIISYEDMIDFTDQERVSRMFSAVALAPTQSLLQKWLREVHNIHCSSDCNASGWMWVIEKTNGTFIKDSEFSGDIPEAGMWETSEEALEEGLIEALKLI